MKSLREGTEKADRARQDPAIQAAARAEYEGRIVDAPELSRVRREREWEARGIPARLWPMLHDGAPELGANPGGPSGPGKPPPAGVVGPNAPKPTPALDAVSRFLSPLEKRTVLVLSGVGGIGKTVAGGWATAWFGGRFVKALDLVRAGLYPADPMFWPRLYGEKLVVIDDLGAEPLDGKGYGIAVITDLIDRRYDAAKKTIITTNLPLVEFKERYGTNEGERLWRRLSEVGKSVELRRHS